MSVIIDTGVDNAGLRSGLMQAESMVDAAVKRISVKMNAAGKITGASMVFAPAQIAAQEKSVGLLAVAATRMEKLQSVGSGLNTVLGRMTGIFSSGMGIYAGIGALSLLGAAFGRAVTMAQRFQTAQISIGAILLSTYKVKDKGGKEADPMTGFMFAHEQALKYNQQIIERSRKNILTYEEQLKAFQVGLAAGGRKGIAPAEVMDISEHIAVGAKAIGLQGERISEQVRILLGGGVNVQRSMFAKILGITSKDISSRSGDDLVKFIESRMKGFQTQGVKDEFKDSIQAIITTMSSQIDVFLATVGTKTMKKLTPILRNFGTFLQGPDAAKLGDMLVTGFTNVFNAIEAIAKSPAIPMLEKFVSFLANEADKIIIGVVFLKLIGIMSTLGAGVAGVIGWFDKLGASAAVAAGEVNGLAAAEARVGLAGLGPGGRTAAAGIGKGIAGAEGAALPEEAALIGLTKGTPAQRAALLRRGGQAGVTGLTAEEEALLAGGGLAATAGAGGMAEEATASIPWWKYSGGALPGAGLAGKAGGWLKGTGARIASRGMGALLAGGMTYGGIKLGADALGMGDYDTHAGVATDTLARTAGGAAAGFQLGGPVGAVIGGTLGAGSELVTLGQQTKAANEQLEKMTKTLADFNAKHPDVPIVLGLKSENKRLEAAIKSGKGFPNAMTTDAQGNMIAAAIDPVGTVSVASQRKQAQAQIDANIKRMNTIAAGEAKKAEAAAKAAYEADPNTRGLHFVNPEQVANLKEQKDAAEANLKAVEMGQGPLREKQAAYWKFNQQATEIRTSLQSHEIQILDKDLVDKNKQYDAEYEHLSNAKRSDQLTKKETARLNFLKEQEYRLQTVQAHRYLEENRAKLKDTMTDLDRQHKEAMTEGDLDTVESQYRKGRSAVEQRLKGEKGALGAAYEPILKKALANFDLTFNVPLKKIEENIKNLELGSAADNVIEAARLSFQAVREKLREQAEAFRKSGGKTGIAPGQAHELLAERQRDYIADLAKAGPELQQFIGENMIRRIQQQQELATTLPNAQRNLAQTRLQGQEFEAGLNPRNANVMARAERIVGLEQPRIGLDEAERMVRQKIELEREGQRAAMVQATSSLEAAKVQTTYVIPAMMALAESAYKNKLPGMNKAAEEATAAIRSMTAGLTKPGSGKGASDHKATSDAEPAKAGAHGATSAGGGHHVTVNVAPKASLTMNDINALLPQIKDALCRQAAISGSRG